MCYVDEILAVGENVDYHLYHLKCDCAVKGVKYSGQTIAR
jgi:hypothetical protein